MQTTVAMAGAMVVVTKIEPNCSTLVAAAPLKPYQPSQRINTPRQPMGRLCPGNALTFVTLPSLFVDGTGAGKIMKAYLGEPAAAPDPVCLNGINQGGDHC